MSRELHFGVVGAGTVLHALGKPQELADAMVGLPVEHTKAVPVIDVDYSAIMVHFPPRWYKVVVLAI